MSSYSTPGSTLTGFKTFERSPSGLISRTVYLRLETETDCVRYGTGLLSESNLDFPTTNLTTSSLKRKLNMLLTWSLHLEILDQHESDFVSDLGPSVDWGTSSFTVLKGTESVWVWFFLGFKYWVFRFEWRRLYPISFIFAMWLKVNMRLIRYKVA